MRQPVTQITGRAVLMARDDMDTDAIFPARFLKTTDRAGMGAHLFADWVAAGHPETAFLKAEHHVQILVAGRNFGCGSSREHAVWALADYGIQAVVALSFGDIFRNNCVKNGIATVTVTLQDHAALLKALDAGDTALELDIAACQLLGPGGLQISVHLAAGHQARLLSGEDDITRTLRNADAIAAHEAKVAAESPWLQRME